MAPVPRPRPGWFLVALLGGMVLGNMDAAIVNIAVPSIQANLHAAGGELDLVVSGYALAYAALVVTCARLGEARGYRRMFLLGLGAFTLTSLVCGLAPDALTLIVARVVQGAGAALMTSQVLTGIQLNFQGTARGRALGLYTAVLSSSAVIGQIVGGLLISANLFAFGWRPAFLINVPTGTLLMFVAARFLPADPERRPGRLDGIGAIALSIALLLLVVPLVLGADEGWSAWVWVCLSASIPAFAVFVAAERRLTARGGRPVIDVRLLSRPAVLWGTVSLGAATSTYFATLFVLALYLQQGLGRSPLDSGLALVSWVAAFGIAGPVLARLPEHSRRRAAPVGYLLLAAGFAGICLTQWAGDTGGTVLMILLGVCGLGLGLGFSGLLAHLTGVVTRDHAADMSGLINTATRVGGVVGIAIFGTAYLGLTPDPGPHAAIRGFAVVTAALAATALGAAGSSHLSIRRSVEAVLSERQAQI